MTTTPSRYIKWTDDEWDTIARGMIAQRPAIVEDISPIVSRAHIAVAMEALPEDRRRNMSSNVALQGAVDKLAKVIPRVQSGPVTITQAAPAAAPAPRREPAYSLVRWTQAERLTLARKLHMTNNLHIQSTTLAGLMPQDLKAAQSILDERRQRKSFNGMARERELFLIAFKELRAILDAEERQRQEAITAARLAQEAQEAAEAAAAAAAVAKINPYEEMFKTFANMLADVVMERMTPIMQTMACEASAGRDVSKVDVAALMANLRGGVSNATGTVTPAAKRIKIGVVGPKPNQARELETSFPQIDFIFHESGSKQGLKGSLGRLDRAIGMVDFMDHSARHALQREYGDLYMSVHGGVSAIKRVINQWIHQGVVA